MDTPSLTAVVVPALNRRPWETDAALEILADDGKTPLRMVLPQLGFRPGQKVRIQVVDDPEVDPFEVS